MVRGCGAPNSWSPSRKCVTVGISMAEKERVQRNKIKKKQAQRDTDQKYKHENKERTADLKQTVRVSSSLHCLFFFCGFHRSPFHHSNQEWLSSFSIKSSSCFLSAASFCFNTRWCRRHDTLFYFRAVCFCDCLTSAACSQGAFPSNEPSSQSVSLWVTLKRHYNEKCHQIVLYKGFFFFCWVLWAHSSSVIVQTSGMFSPLGDPRHFGGKLFLADCLLLFRGLMFVPCLPRGGW